MLVLGWIMELGWLVLLFWESLLSRHSQSMDIWIKYK